MKRSALCLVDTEAQADAIVEKLRSAGFSDSDISVLFPDKGSTRDFAHKKETKMPEGATVGAGVGGLTGALVGLGIPEYEAKRYEGKVKEGGILISVHSENSDETSRAKGIFKEEGAHDISSTGEAHADVKAEDGTAETRVPEVT